MEVNNIMPKQRRYYQGKRNRGWGRGPRGRGGPWPYGPQGRGRGWLSYGPDIEGDAPAGPPPWAPRWGWAEPPYPEMPDEPMGPPPWAGMNIPAAKDSTLSAEAQRAWLEARKAHLTAWKEHLESRLAEIEAALADLDQEA